MKKMDSYNTSMKYIVYLYGKNEKTLNFWAHK